MAECVLAEIKMVLPKTNLSIVEISKRVHAILIDTFQLSSDDLEVKIFHGEEMSSEEE